MFFHPIQCTGIANIYIIHFNITNIFTLQSGYLPLYPKPSISLFSMMSVVWINLILHKREIALDLRLHTNQGWTNMFLIVCFRVLWFSSIAQVFFVYLQTSQLLSCFLKIIFRYLKNALFGNKVFFLTF